MYEHDALGKVEFALLFDKGQKQSSALSCNCSYCFCCSLESLISEFQVSSLGKLLFNSDIQIYQWMS